LVNNCIRLFRGQVPLTAARHEFECGRTLSSAGYERGTITPFGSATALPVIADERTWAGRSRSGHEPTVSPRRSLPTT
jgi:hypothetical protein